MMKVKIKIIIFRPTDPYRTNKNIFKVGPSCLKIFLFGISYPGFHLVGRSVDIFSSFFNIYYICTWTEMVKKKKSHDLEKK